MIRINLLAVERERARKRVLIPAAHRVTIGATVILLGTALLIGWWFWSLRQESIRVDEELARAESRDAADPLGAGAGAEVRVAARRCCSSASR